MSEFPFSDLYRVRNTDKNSCILGICRNVCAYMIDGQTDGWINGCDECACVRVYEYMYVSVRECMCVHMRVCVRVLCVCMCV